MRKWLLEATNPSKVNNLNKMAVPFLLLVAIVSFYNQPIMTIRLAPTKTAAISFAKALILLFRPRLCTVETEEAVSWQELQLSSSETAILLMPPPPMVKLLSFLRNVFMVENSPTIASETPV